jgi:poly(3-hydroxyoctanoate) depolymerase
MSAPVTGHMSLRIHGSTIRLRVQGQGRPLLLIMGIGASLELWRPLSDELLPLGYQVITFDLPGAGASPPVWPPPRMPGLALVAEGVLDELGIREADVLGVSFGGAVAQEMARRAPERIRRLVLAATGPGLGSLPGKPSALVHLLSPLRYVSPSYASRVAGTLYGGQARSDSSLHTALISQREKAPEWLGYLGQLYAIAGWSSMPWLLRLRTRTLVLAGEDDPIIPLSGARLLAQLMPNATMRVIRGGGHLFLLDESQLSARLVDDFLRAD